MMEFLNYLARQSSSRIPAWEILPPLFAAIKPLGRDVPWLEFLKRDSSATFGLEGEFVQGFGLMGRHLDGVDEPFLLIFHCERGHIETGGARSC